MEKKKIEYKVRFSSESSNNKIPSSIVRKMVGEDTYVIESCNQYREWTSSPDSISCWIGSSDGDWHSAPDSKDMPIEFIEKWVSKWEKNWPDE